jgi:hypothetical protein
MEARAVADTIDGGSPRRRPLFTASAEGVQIIPYDRQTRREFGKREAKQFVQALFGGSLPSAQTMGPYGLRLKIANPAYGRRWRELLVVNKKIGETPYFRIWFPLSLGSKRMAVKFAFCVASKVSADSLEADVLANAAGMICSTAEMLEPPK